MNAVADAAVRALSFGYRPRGGVLQQARATVVVGWCLALGLVLALYENPLVIAAVFALTILMAWRCRVLGEVTIGLAISAPIALLIGMVNPIATQEGLTVLVAGIHLPLLGTIDITREAVVYGAILGFRSLAIFAVCALYVATVDPDTLLRVLRRFSVRSAITASLAVRFVPLLAKDGANLAIARECRPGSPPATAAVVRSAFARSLDRATDSAVALETRGYSLARPLRTRQAPRRIADWALIASAWGVTALAVAGKLYGFADFQDYPLTVIGSGADDIAFSALLIAVAAAPGLLPRKEPDE
ncbi:MAG: energy-coupling factor transporter transmembrane component T family protein [Solirubrobacterales bacterium]